MQNSHSNSYVSSFFVVPTYILDLPGMTLGYLRVYEAMFQFWNHNKTCFLSEKALCEKSNLKRTQVYAALAFFEHHNEIKRVQKGNKRYLIKPEKSIETDCKDIGLVQPTEGRRTKITQPSGLADVDVRPSGRLTSGGADYNTKKLNKEFNKTSTGLVSSVFFITEKIDKEYLALKLENDNRSDEEFLKQCKHHIENNSNLSMHVNQRRCGLKKILTKCFEANEIFESLGYGEIKTKKSGKIDCPFSPQELEIAGEFKQALKMNQLEVFYPDEKKFNKAKAIYEKVQNANKRRMPSHLNQARR